MVKVIMTLAAAFAVSTLGVRADESATAAMKPLQSLAGSWRCAIVGGVSNGAAEDADYTFSPDGLWMTERTSSAGHPEKDWTLQMWGWDARMQHLVAYQFTEYGVGTKTIDGWKDGDLVTHRDDNGAEVRLKIADRGRMQWIVTTADGKYTTTEDCRRR